jgi:amino acid transporter
LNLLGQVAGAASTEYGAAQLLLAAVSMASGFNYAPTNNQTVGVMAAITIFHGFLNSLTTNALEKMTRTYVFFHFAVLISCCITLLVMCKNKHDSSYVWTTVIPDSGWTPTGFSFLFGFLSASWTMTGMSCFASYYNKPTDR